MKLVVCALPCLLSVALALGAFTEAYNISGLLSELGPATEVFYHSDANWTDTVQRWMSYDEPTFVAALKPALVADLQTIVSYLSIILQFFFCAAKHCLFLLHLGKMIMG